MITGFDCAAPVTDYLPAIKAAGYQWIGRYYSHHPAKSLTRDEADAIAAAGLRIVTVWEAAGDSIAGFGAAKGFADGAAALAQAHACGQPLGTPIYFAVDFDAAPQQLDEIGAYFAAVKTALGGQYLVGVYGSGLVCQMLLNGGEATRTWLGGAMGWRGSRDFLAGNRWQIRQHPPIDGPPGVPFQIDPNEVQGAIGFGSWVPDGAVVASVPAPPSARDPQAVIAAIKALQTVLVSYGYRGRIDGDWGRQSQTAMQAFKDDATG